MVACRQGGETSPVWGDFRGFLKPLGRFLLWNTGRITALVFLFLFGGLWTCGCLFCLRSNTSRGGPAPSVFRGPWIIATLLVPKKLSPGRIKKFPSRCEKVVKDALTSGRTRQIATRFLFLRPVCLCHGWLDPLIEMKFVHKCVLLELFYPLR